MKEKETIQRLLTIACLITILLSTGVCGASTEGDPNFSYITDDFSVTFSVISENVTGLSWDFGDGATSTDQNPTHAYTSAGEYPVTLTVGDNSVTKIVKVTAALPPVAKFTADVTEGLAPLKVHFTDKSENAEGCEYSWDLGDGTTSSEKNPTHTFEASRYAYTVILTLKKGEQVSQYSIEIRAKAVPILPVADFDATPTKGKAPLTVKITDKSQNAAFVSWKFGDGSYQEGKGEIIHIFENPGDYPVTQTATNGNGSANKTILITVEGKSKPVAEFSATPTSGKAPLNVKFTDKSTGAPTAWKWNFGDGVSSEKQNPSHTYNTLGRHEATLTVKNEKGDTSSSSVVIQVFKPESPTEADPEAEFTFEVVEGCPQVQFIDKSKHAASWLWDFGDNSTSTERDPTHTYLEAGRFNVNLTVFNENGENSISKTVVIEEEKKSSPNHKNCGGMTSTSSTVPVKTADKVCPTNQTTVPDQKVAPVTKKTGASLCNTAPKIINKSSRTERLNIGMTSIIPTIKIEKKNSAGHHNGIQLRILPKVDFDATIQGVSSIQFHDRSSRVAEKWCWDFGDGTKSTKQNPVHKYKTGKYTVSLTITGEGYKRMLTRIDYITV